MWIKLSLLFTFQVIICFCFDQTIPASLEVSLSAGTLVQIEQNVYLKGCNIQADKAALYVCEKQVYLFTDDNTERFFSSLQINKNLALGADMDDNGIIIVEPNKISVRMNLHTIDKIFFYKEFPLMWKVNSKSEYLLIAAITKTRPITFEIVDSEDIVHERVNAILDESGKSDYFIHTFLRGSAPSSYRTRFPMKSVDFQLKENSFKQITIFNDPLFGNDYLIVGMERGWIVIFQSVFQNAQMDFLHSKQITTDFEIIEMTIIDSYLFLLLSKDTENLLKVEIYRLSTHHRFKLLKECTLDLSQYFHLEYTPQLRVKLFDGIFILMVNFPGELITAYHFKKPSSNVFSLECPKEPALITYKDAIKDFKIGFSFDYVAKSYLNGLVEHRIILSSFSVFSTAIYYIPYCLPNTYRDPIRGCLPCKEGFSFGGITPICLSCDDTNVKTSKIFAMKCPYKCDTPGRFGKDCLTCRQYMKALGAALPKDAEWAIDSRGECLFKCKKGIKISSQGVCLSLEEFNLNKNECSQIRDCLNCSMSQTCSWFMGSCQPIFQDNTSQSPKPSTLDNVLLPAAQCEMRKSCGQEEYRAISDVIRFSAESLYKNQVCRWHIQLYGRSHNQIELKITVEESLAKEVENLPILYIQSYDGKDTELKSGYSIKKLVLTKGTIYVNIVATDLFLWAHVEQNILGKGYDMKIEYRLVLEDNILDKILFGIKWFYYIVFICIGITFMLATGQKVSNYYRRRRLLAELQNMEGFNGIELIEERQGIIDVDQVMKNQKVVCKLIHDGVKVNRFEQTECSICLEEFKKGETLAEFFCNHVFHVKCFESWIKLANLQVHLKCPVCNRILA